MPASAASAASSWRPSRPSASARFDVAAQRQLVVAAASAPARPLAQRGQPVVGARRGTARALPSVIRASASCAARARRPRRGHGALGGRDRRSQVVDCIRCRWASDGEHDARGPRTAAPPGAATAARSSARCASSVAAEVEQRGRAGLEQQRAALGSAVGAELGERLVEQRERAVERAGAVRGERRRGAAARSRRCRSARPRRAPAATSRARARSGAGPPPARTARPAAAAVDEAGSARGRSCAADQCSASTRPRSSSAPARLGVRVDSACA